MGNVLICVALIIGMTPFLSFAINAHAQSLASDRIDQTTAERSDKNELLSKARDYNKRLATQGQSIIGDVVDPFNGKANALVSSVTDDGYNSILDMSADGVMGTISIPSISVRLPIYHGTGTTALNSGAGHVRGTSFPIGGSSTHAVIAAHRGLSNKLMFTRLDEMRTGDMFYVTVLGRTLAYQVISTRVVEPTQTDLLTIRKGKDLVTLMTCTPYGVNTQRILVTGSRVPMTQSAVKSQQSEVSDPLPVIVVAILAGLVVGALIGTVVRGRTRPKTNGGMHVSMRAGAR